MGAEPAVEDGARVGLLDRDAEQLARSRVHIVGEGRRHWLLKQQ